MPETSSAAVRAGAGTFRGLLAGRGFMTEYQEALHETADYVTSGIDEDGIERALKVFGLL